VKDRRFWFPVSRPDDRAIPSGRPSDQCSIHPDDVPYRSNASQTKHHLSGLRAFPSGPSTVLRSFYQAWIHPDVSAARLDASRYSTSLRFFPCSDKGKIDQPSGRCSIPSGRESPYGKNRNSNITVRTLVNLGPDVRATNMEITNSTSTVWTTASHGPDARITDMEIVCCSSAVRTLIPHGPNARSLIRKLLARTCNCPEDVPSRPDTALKQERFLSDIFKKSCLTVVCLDSHDHRPDGAQLYFS